MPHLRLCWAAMLLPIVAAIVAAPPARAAQPADLALVLAVDVSWSMDSTEQNLQRKGYIDAFRDPAVLAAIRAGDIGRIAVSYLEWAGTDQHRVVMPWMIVDSADSAERVASTLEEAPISRMRRTSISGGLLAADALLASSGVEATRKAVDVSGDGPNNAGEPVTIARDQLVHEGVVINGLPIMIYQGGEGDYFGRANLDKYYQHCVIGGTGSFLLVIQHPEQFGDAIRRKLILEIAGARARVLPVQYAPPQPEAAGVDCLQGEKRWGHWQSNP